ncbi:MAG: hypothetical protein L0Y72_20010 [Gemmataceae bacterium]|nr:hypothetical protein [Gemmataceae bacterium]MCI0741322.1 hypothetical protein [Gemmataceae bacterium]
MFQTLPLLERPPTVELMRKLGFEPDPWQVEVLESQHPQLLLNCCRQAGKSTVVAVLALVHALFNANFRVLILSRSHRQSKELLRLIKLFHRMLSEQILKRQTAEELELMHLSRIVSMPCKEDTIRGFSHVNLLIVDEAAQVPDDVYRTVRPMLAVSKGRIICLSTPHGRRGFFWNAWQRGGDAWARFEIPASMIPRITPEFLAKERDAIGESWFRQEYCCSFEALEGVVYPDFARCVVDELPAHVAAVEAQHTDWFDGQRLGGIDFGFRNPFAAIWGVKDRDDVIWLTGEHYHRQKPLWFHAEHLPRDVVWYADPSGATEIEELIRANCVVRKGINALRAGIAAVSARLQNGTLKVLKGRCPNLLAEAGLYRYGTRPTEAKGEEPVDAHNHALAALRYLISTVDRGRMALEKLPPPSPPIPPRKWWDGMDDDDDDHPDNKAWVRC